MSHWKTIKLFRDWLGSHEPANPLESLMRAGRCCACPKNNTNLKVEDVFKGIVAKNVKRLLELRHNVKLQTPFDDKLGVCEVCSCVLKLKVHAPIELIKEETSEEMLKELPDECWVKRELRYEKTED